MRNLLFLVMLMGLSSTSPLCAQTRLNSVSGPGPTFAAPYNNPAFTNYGTFYPGTPGAYNPYANYGAPYATPGYGYGYGRSMYGVPVLAPNGLYRFGTGTAAMNMWRAQSGYYYPWAGLPVGMGYNPNIIYYSAQQNAAPVQQQPPIPTIIRDLISYLDEAKEKGRISESDYQHLKQRALDIQSKEDMLATQGGGHLESGDEQSIRTDIDSLGAEVTRRSHQN